MVLFRRKKNADSENLLESRKKGLFRKKNPRSSDANAKTVADPKAYVVPDIPVTPPITPATPSSSSSGRPPAVTVKQSQTVPAVEESYHETPVVVRSQRPSQRRADESIASEAPSSAVTSAAAERNPTTKFPAFSNGAVESRSAVEPGVQQKKPDAAPENTSYLSQIFGFVELTCFAPSAHEENEDDFDIRKNLSFTPEWGVAPVGSDDGTSFAGGSSLAASTWKDGTTVASRAYTYDDGTTVNDNDNVTVASTAIDATTVGTGARSVRTDNRTFLSSTVGESEADTRTEPTGRTSANETRETTLSPRPTSRNRDDDYSDQNDDDEPSSPKSVGTTHEHFELLLQENYAFKGPDRRSWMEEEGRLGARPNEPPSAQEKRSFPLFGRRSQSPSRSGSAQDAPARSAESPPVSPADEKTPKKANKRVTLPPVEPVHEPDFSQSPEPITRKKFIPPPTAPVIEPIEAHDEEDDKPKRGFRIFNKVLRSNRRNSKKPPTGPKHKIVKQERKPILPTPSLVTDPSAPLPPVIEESDDETSIRKTRVPGIGKDDLFIETHELVGDEVVEDTDDDDEEEKAYEKPVLPGDAVLDEIGLEMPHEEEKKEDEAYSYSAASSASHFTLNEAALASRNPEIEQMSDRPGEITKSFSFMEMMRRNRSDNTASDSHAEASRSDPGASNTLRTASATLLAKGFRNAKSDKPKDKNKTQKAKPQWKEVLDASSGKTYFYHRVTRQTTWTRPPEDDLVPLKPKDKSLQTIKEGRTFQPKRTRSANAILSGTKEKVEKALNITKKTDKAVSTKTLTLAENGTPKSDEQSPENTRDNAQKKEIADILSTLVPNENGRNGADRLVTQYKGREDELLSHLRSLAEAQPFDELLESPSTDKDDRKLQQTLSADEVTTGAHSAAPTTIHDNKSVGNRTRTGASVFSGVSTGTKISEKTQQIKNTSTGKMRIDDTVEETDSQQTSISSKHETGYIVESVPSKNNGVPSNVPVLRARELAVEEFASDGVKAETFDTKTTNRQSSGRKTMMSPRELLSLRKRGSQSSNSTSHTYPEQPSQDNETDSNRGNDSISALTDHDAFSSPRNHSLDDARRRALDEAIAREDWDLAAALSEGMRALHAKDKNGQRRDPREQWKQSELDRFISDNDWDAVANYIAHVRAKAVQHERMAPPHALPPRPPRAADFISPKYAPIPPGRFPSSSTSDSSAHPAMLKKRFGARSQLQHDMQSHSSSWDESTQTSYESHDGTSDESDVLGPRSASTSRRRLKEFAC